jgi:hypothetical protein
VIMRAFSGQPADLPDRRRAGAHCPIECESLGGPLSPLGAHREAGSGTS